MYKYPPFNLIIIMIMMITFNILVKDKTEVDSLEHVLQKNFNIY